MNIIIKHHNLLSWLDWRDSTLKVSLSNNLSKNGIYIYIWNVACDATCYDNWRSINDKYDNDLPFGKNEQIFPFKVKDETLFDDKV